jgi:hypothetical protein
MTLLMIAGTDRNKIFLALTSCAIALEARVWQK